jgi:hypothetical protein
VLTRIFAVACTEGGDSTEGKLAELQGLRKEALHAGVEADRVGWQLGLACKSNVL